MRVLLDTSYARRGRSGTAVYLDRLGDALRASGAVEVVEASRSARGARGGGNPLRSAINVAGDRAWLHRGLPRAARAAGADVVHHPLPVLSRGLALPQVVTLHDAAFAAHPEAYGRAWRLIDGRLHARAVRRADAVVCVSEATAAEAEALLGARSERLVVARHGPGQRMPAAAPPEGPRHFLYVGDAEPRKDVPSLLDAFAAYRPGAEQPLDLVLAGRAASLAGAAGVRGEPGPSPSRLSELYAGAAALVHPSRHEGFGLTLLEAMDAGVPVVAVSNAGVREIAGDAALLTDADGLAGALARVAGDGALRERLSRAGAERAAAFSWEEAARRHVEAYTLARESHGRAS